MVTGRTAPARAAAQAEIEANLSGPPPATHSATLRLRLRPSRQLKWLLGVGHVAAVVVCWTAPITWWLRLGLSLAVMVSLGFSMRRVVRAWNGVELRPDGTAAVQDRRGRWREVRVLGSSFVSPMLTVLNLGVAGARLPRSLVVAPDALSAEEFRRLRVWLRWRGARAAVAPCR